MNIAIISLGCPKNQVDADVFCHALIKAGHTTVADPAQADVILINTCGFIESAKAEAIENILMACQYKQQNPDLKVVVTGCLAERYKQQIIQEMPEVDAVIGIGSNKAIPAIIERVCTPGAGQVESYGPKSDMPLGGARVISTPQHYAYLKIAEGCNNRCHYCAIPLIRGGHVSVPMEELEEEARKLAAGGVKELIVIAQDITKYGMDLPGHQRLLPELLRRLCEMDFHWVRLHYLYPDQITDELVEVIASEPKIVKYLDIPLQHVSKRILRAMHRPGDVAEFSSLIASLRQRIPSLVLRTSLIVGLPGETEEEFAELCTFLQETQIERVGVFEFSPEEGTEAAELPDQIDAAVKANRRLIVEELQSGVLDDYNTSRHGEVMEVLCEGFDEEQQLWYGRTYADSVEVDGHVYFEAEDAPVAGGFVPVRITDSLGPDLLGVRQKGE